MMMNVRYDSERNLRKKKKLSTEMTLWFWDLE